LTEYHQILVEERANPQVDIENLECEINMSVYDLYGLGKEERDIVEGRS
jgi:hypothetical protein